MNECVARYYGNASGVREGTVVASTRSKLAKRYLNIFNIIITR
jgi:hypothetical protein